MRLTRALVQSFLPKRPLHSHKGTYGKVLIIAGSIEMSGAAVLCARAVLKTGAGGVALALPKSSHCVVAAALPEMITCPLPQREGVLSEAALGKINTFIEKFSPSVVLIGPGLSQTPFVVSFLKKYTIPCVIDADALNALAQEKKEINYLKMPHIFTPHPGEIRRLLKSPIGKEKKQRIQCAKKLTERLGGVCLLKGFESIITDGEKIYINPTGGPALAKAGSGDTLAGFIAGIWAQLGTANGFDKVTALQAAACGAYLHGLCGDLLTQKMTERCVLASDLTNVLPQAFKKVLKGR